ncbi:hypothetical protein V3C99_016144, partial [Haemonchus contortus]
RYACSNDHDCVVPGCTNKHDNSSVYCRPSFCCTTSFGQTSACQTTLWPKNRRIMTSLVAPKEHWRLATDIIFTSID